MCVAGLPPGVSLALPLSEEEVEVGVVSAVVLYAEVAGGMFEDAAVDVDAAADASCGRPAAPALAKALIVPDSDPQANPVHGPSPAKLSSIKTYVEHEGDGLGLHEEVLISTVPDLKGWEF